VRIRILVADDNEVARGLLRDVLKARADWEICGEAMDGKHAIQKALELKPDIILMDLAMPNMDGLTAARAIRKLLPGTPILLVSLHTLPQVELMARSAGIDKVVSKNDADTTLLQAIEQTLLERSAKAAMAAAAGTTSEKVESGRAAANSQTAPQQSEIASTAAAGSEPKKEENGGSQAN
jgi:DNA-binding NarL/FixJ family response regulator